MKVAVLLLLGLVVMSMGTEGRHHKRHDEDEEEDDNDYDDAGAEALKLVEKSASATSATAQQDSDLISSLYKLVQQGKVEDQKLQQELSTEAQQASALQADLAAKQAQHQRHQQLMTRLTECLKEPSPAKSNSFVEQAARVSGTCDCDALKQQIADAKMARDNNANDEKYYKVEYEKAKAALKATQAKLQQISDREHQPTVPLPECDQAKDCRSCTANPRCGWCSSSSGFGGVPKGQGMCRRADVTARLRGVPQEDGLTSGECKVNAWQSSVTNRISTLSYNVFASDINHARARAKQIFALIQHTDPSIIAFQEVETWFLQALKLEPWIRAYFQSDFGNGRAPGGLYILSKFPIAKVGYFEGLAPGQVQYDQRARVLVVEAAVPSTVGNSAPKTGKNAAAAMVANGEATTLTIATTVLDWRSAKNRIDGLDFVTSVLAPHDDVILLGDFNFDQAAEPETSHVPRSYLDVWPALNPSKRGYTWNPDTNPYARASDPASRPSRIDRIFVKSPHWLPRSIKLAGCGSDDLLCTKHFQANAKDADSNLPVKQLPPNYRPHRIGQKASFVELAAEVDAEVDAETLQQGDVTYPSNHYALIAHFSRFSPKC